MSAVPSHTGMGNLTDLPEKTADERLALVSDDGARFELRCAACGYGVVVRIAPDTCPMCKGTVWEHVAPVPSGDDSQREAGRPR